MIEDIDQAVAALADAVRRRGGVDLTGYRREHVIRRVHARMDELGADSVCGYAAHVRSHPAEADALVESILIDVSHFFRDAHAWEVLRTTVVPQLVDAVEPGRPVRVWSAGCASGEEAYSLAMLFADTPAQRRSDRRVQIYATDVADAALTAAGRGSYDGTSIQNVSASFRSRFFDRAGPRFVANTTIRRTVLFGRSDLLRDAPISEVDLLVCRNVLIYFDAHAQRRVLDRFHLALAPHGTLFLGPSEVPLSHGDRFTPLDMPNRIFRRQAPQRTTFVTTSPGQGRP